jgi:predicted DCC family thiol-disulfide oxidoreductase YuxK
MLMKMEKSSDSSSGTMRDVFANTSLGKLQTAASGRLVVPQSTGRPGSLTVVFDGECVLCRRSVHWLSRQNQAVPIRSIPASSSEAIDRFGHIPDYGADMIVAADDGRMWIGPPDAYLAVMWAIPSLRALSYVLAIRQLKPLVRRVFQLVTGNRQLIGGLLGDSCERCATGIDHDVSLIRHS